MKPCWKCNGAGVLCRHCHRATDACRCMEGMPLNMRTSFEEDPPNESCIPCGGSGMVRTNYAGTRECQDVG